MRTIDTYTLSRIVLPKGEPIFSDQATTVRIEDDAAGPFVAVEQENGTIRIVGDEWPAIRATIDEMFGVCRRIEEDMRKDASK